MNDIIRKLFFDVVIAAVIKQIVAQIPFLGIPIVGPIFGWIIGWVAGKLYDQLATVAAFTLIDIKTEDEQKQYDQAVINLKLVLEKPEGEQNAADIEAAKLAFKKHLSDLIKLKPTP